MAKTSKPKRSPKKRVKVKDLPAADKKLTAKEMKQVEGGKVREATARMNSHNNLKRM